MNGGPQFTVTATGAGLPGGAVTVRPPSFDASLAKLLELYADHRVALLEFVYEADQT